MATGIALDFLKLPSDQNVTVSIGLASAVADVQNPTAAELNAMQPASVSISWNDFDFGIQASESVNEPSLADVANYEDFGAANYGGAISYYYPKDYDDNSNNHSLVYDLTDIPGTMNIIAIRIDGDKKTSTPFADGDFVHVFLAQTDSEQNSLQGADALRRTVGYLQQSVFSVYTVVGGGAPTPKSATATVEAGKSKRMPCTVGGREFTNACEFRSSAPATLRVGRGGVYTGVAAGTATVTVTNPYTGQTGTFEVTVS